MERYEYSVVEVAKELAMAACGSGDWQEKHAQLSRWLLWRVSTAEWQPTAVLQMGAYDEAVRAMANEALVAYERFEKEMERVTYTVCGGKNWTAGDHAAMASLAKAAAARVKDGPVR